MINDLFQQKITTLLFDIKRFLPIGGILGCFGRLTLQFNLGLNFILVDEIRCLNGGVRI